MTDDQGLEPGSVWRLIDRDDPRPKRVLMSNSETTLYDAWWDHIDRWGIGDLAEARRRKIYYYSIPTAALARIGQLLRVEPLSEAEEELHRPDLPLSVGQTDQFDWWNDGPASEAELSERIHAAGASLRGADSIAAARLLLAGLGPAGATKAGVAVTPDDGHTFSAVELLFKAWEIQSKITGQKLIRSSVLVDSAKVTGVGLYRLGLQRGLPIYHLWGFDKWLPEDG